MSTPMWKDPIEIAWRAIHPMGRGKHVLSVCVSLLVMLWMGGCGHTICPPHHHDGSFFAPAGTTCGPKEIALQATRDGTIGIKVPGGTIWEANTLPLCVMMDSRGIAWVRCDDPQDKAPRSFDVPQQSQ